MLPQLKAGESLKSVTEVALGNDRIQKYEMRRIMHEWEKDANQGIKQKMTKDQAAVMLTSMGIKVETKNG